MAHPEVSCHPELLLDGARTVVSAALCYWVDAPSRARARDAFRATPGVTTTRFSANASTRSAGGSAGATGSRRREPTRRPRGARRAGVGFYGKNTMLITREHGSWVVLGTLVTDAEIESSAPLDLDCGRCRLCIDACPTGALDEPGVLDANRCLSYWTQAPAPIPEPYRVELGRIGLRLRYLPGRLPLEPRHRAPARRPAAPGRATPTVSLARVAHARRRGAGRGARPPLRSAQRPPLAAPERARRARQRGEPRRPAARRGMGGTTTR